MSITSVSPSLRWPMPRLQLSDGATGVLKWLALVLMTGDHVNKYLFNGTLPVLYEAGRLALPIFAIVLGHNLARPRALERGVYRRTCWRLAMSATIATVPFVALGGHHGDWISLNILFALLAATGALWLLDQGGAAWIAIAVVIAAAAGFLVEFRWLGIAICWAAWSYSRRPTPPALACLVAAVAALTLINGNWWALAALPAVVVAAARLERTHLPRLRGAFYAYYPLHLGVLWAVRIPMAKAGFLFFT